jgi:hypothetical protein
LVMAQRIAQYNTDPTFSSFVNSEVFGREDESAMRYFCKSTRRWALLLAMVLASFEVRLTAATKTPDLTVPERLRGRQSYWIQERPILSKSDISKKLTRPGSVRDLLRNLYVVWTDRLLVEPNFYDESVLLICFGGTGVNWKDRRIDPAGSYSNLVAEIELDARAFPRAVVVVRLYREKVQATDKPRLYFPTHQHYFGHIDLSVQGVDTFTWEQTTRVFGQNAISLPVMGIDVPGIEQRNSVVALMRYSYPGDDPSRFGYLELPQTEVWLSGSRPDVPVLERQGPRGTDKVTRISIMETMNRVQGENVGKSWVR